MSCTYCGSTEHSSEEHEEELEYKICVYCGKDDDHNSRQHPYVTGL